MKFKTKGRENTSQASLTRKAHGNATLEWACPVGKSLAHATKPVYTWTCTFPHSDPPLFSMIAFPFMCTIAKGHMVICSHAQSATKLINGLACLHVIWHITFVFPSIFKPSLIIKSLISSFYYSKNEESSQANEKKRKPDSERREKWVIMP